MSTERQLHTFFRSSTSYRLRIALALKNLAYEPRYVNLPKMEHRAEDYLKVNPQGLVPALVEDGLVVTQSMAMIEYLDEKYPEPPLMPGETAARWYVRALSQIIGCEIHPLNNVRVLKYIQGTLGADDDAKQAWYEHWLATGLEAFEQMLVGRGLAGRYCYADMVTMADVCLVPQIFNAKRFNCPLAGYPRTMEIFEACMALPAFADTQPSKQADAF